MTPDQFTAQLGMLLRDQPRGTAADLTDFAVAYWNGHSVVYAFLLDGDNLLDEEFELDDYEWGDWSAPFCAWLDAPTYSTRPEVLEWINTSPPRRGVIDAICVSGSRLQVGTWLTCPCAGAGCRQRWASPPVAARPS